jgi:ABC-type enterobactin transport system permease subunit
MKTVPVLVVALVPASLALAIAFGSVDLGPAQLADALLFRGDEIPREIVWGVRAPRALAVMRGASRAGGRSFNCS